jgi:hypothetical protein
MARRQTSATAASVAARRSPGALETDRNTRRRRSSLLRRTDGSAVDPASSAIAAADPIGPPGEEPCRRCITRGGVAGSGPWLATDFHRGAGPARSAGPLPAMCENPPIWLTGLGSSGGARCALPWVISVDDHVVEPRVWQTGSRAPRSRPARLLDSCETSSRRATLHLLGCGPGPSSTVDHEDPEADAGEACAGSARIADPIANDPRGAD